jgi:hypothetical protein
MDWDGTLVGYASGGSGGSPVTPTAVGDEAIWVNVGSGTLTINVTGGTTPSIRSAGATVNVVAGLITLKVTVTENDGTTPIVGANVWLGKSSDKAQLLNAATNGSGIVSTSIAYDVDTPMVGWARQADLVGTDYDTKEFTGTYTSTGADINVTLTPTEI